MPTFKICVFKHHQRKSDGKFRVSIRLTHHRKLAYIRTDTYLSAKQISPDFKSIKDTWVTRLIDRDIIEFNKILLTGLGANLSKFSARQLVEYIEKYKATEGGVNIDFIAFCEAHISTIRAAGRHGSAERFDAVIRHVIDFFGRSFVSIKEINVKNLREFAEYLQKPREISRQNQLGRTTITKKAGIKAQTAKDYLADIQTLFNAACDKYNDEDSETALITHRPFSSKKLQIVVKDEPQKRDLPVEELIKILQADNLPGQRMQLARDVLALSFYLVAMNTADIFGSDAKLTCRRITYHRQKTATRRKDEALLSIRIEPEVLALLRKYRDPSKKRLFNFYTMYSDFRTFNQNVNIGCKKLAVHLGITPKLSTYYIRHTWATIASEDCGISEHDIAIALNHVSADKGLEKTIGRSVTRGYIHRRFTRIDEMHRSVLNFVKSQY